MSTTSLIARQCRLREWAQMVQDCKSRPEEMSVDEWCEAHSITKANYYWRLRKVREALLTAADPAPTFVELKEPEALPSVPESAREENSFKVAAIINKNSYSIEITNQASTSFLQNLLEAVNHA